MKNKLYTYKVIKINRVVDGDTVDVTIDLGFNIFKKLRVRCLHYDAPEVYHASEEEKKLGLIAKQKLEELLFSSIQESGLYLRTYKDPSIYSRWYGEFITENQLNINLIMKEYCRQLKKEV